RRLRGSLTRTGEPAADLHVISTTTPHAAPGPAPGAAYCVLVPWSAGSVPSSVLRWPRPSSRGESVSFIEAVILGLVQALTEFLPVSSSAHVRVAGELLMPG